MTNPAQQAALSAVSAAFDGDNAAYAQLLASSGAQHDADVAALGNLQKAFDTYKATHPDLPPAGPIFGVTVGANDSRLPAGIKGGSVEAFLWGYNKARAALKRDLGSHIKFFGTKGIADAYGKWKDSKITERQVLLTNEVWDPAALDDTMSLLNVPINYCWRQEFMDKVLSAKDFDTYLGQLNDTRAQIDAHPNGHLVTLQIIGNEAIERKAVTDGTGAVWKKMVDKMPERCVIGNDTYVSVLGMLDPAKGMKGSLDWFAAAKQTKAGTMLGISESGFSGVNFSTDQRVAAIKAYQAKIIEVGGSSYAYWASCNLDKGAANDWSLDGAGQEKFAAAVAAIVN